MFNRRNNRNAGFSLRPEGMGEGGHRFRESLFSPSYRREVRDFNRRSEGQDRLGRSVPSNRNNYHRTTRDSWTSSFGPGSAVSSHSRRRLPLPDGPGVGDCAGTRDHGSRHGSHVSLQRPLGHMNGPARRDPPPPRNLAELRGIDSAYSLNRNGSRDSGLPAYDRDGSRGRVGSTPELRRREPQYDTRNQPRGMSFDVPRNRQMNMGYVGPRRSTLFPGIRFSNAGKVPP